MMTAPATSASAAPAGRSARAGRAPWSRKICSYPKKYPRICNYQKKYPKICNYQRITKRSTQVVRKKSLFPKTCNYQKKYPKICSDPISADHICPFPSSRKRPSWSTTSRAPP